MVTNPRVRDIANIKRDLTIQRDRRTLVRDHSGPAFLNLSQRMLAIITTLLNKVGGIFFLRKCWNDGRIIIHYRHQRVRAKFDLVTNAGRATMVWVGGFHVGLFPLAAVMATMAAGVR